MYAPNWPLLSTQPSISSCASALHARMKLEPKFVNFNLAGLLPFIIDLYLRHVVYLELLWKARDKQENDGSQAWNQRVTLNSPKQCSGYVVTKHERIEIHLKGKSSKGIANTVKAMDGIVAEDATVHVSVLGIIVPPLHGTEHPCKRIISTQNLHHHHHHHYHRLPITIIIIIAIVVNSLVSSSSSSSSLYRRRHHHHKTCMSSSSPSLPPWIY